MALKTVFTAGDKLLASELNTILKGLRGHIGGLQLSNDSDTDHDILLKVGSCIDSDGTDLLILGTEITKRIDATWLAGDNNGGLFSGAVAVNTWYHFFIIAKTDGTIDAGFDTSVTAANIPSGYTLFRRLGSVLTDGSANILAFRQAGDYFFWDVPIEEFAENIAVTTRVEKTLARIPIDLKINAILRFTIIDATHAATWRLLITDPDQTDTAPTASIHTVYMENNAGGETVQAVQGTWLTDTSAKIAYRSSTTTADQSIRCMNDGWIDSRGKDD